MRRTPILVVLVSMGTVGLAGCGASTAEPTTEAPSAPTVVPVADADESEPTDTTSATSDVDGADPTVAGTAAAVPVPAPEGGSSTGGEQPTLSWEPVDGAVLYSVVVHTADGQPFWGWLGEATTVTVGNGAPDPLVSPDMTWSVVALDAEDIAVWESGRLPV